MDRIAREKMEQDFMRLMSGRRAGERPPQPREERRQRGTAQPLWKFLCARSGEEPLTFCRGRQGAC